jgi:hypothetical protein
MVVQLVVNTARTMIRHHHHLGHLRVRGMEAEVTALSVEAKAESMVVQLVASRLAPFVVVTQTRRVAIHVVLALAPTAMMTPQLKAAQHATKRSVESAVIDHRYFSASHVAENHRSSLTCVLLVGISPKGDLAFDVVVNPDHHHNNNNHIHPECLTAKHVEMHFPLECAQCATLLVIKCHDSALRYSQ